MKNYFFLLSKLTICEYWFTNSVGQSAIELTVFDQENKLLNKYESKKVFARLDNFKLIKINYF